MIDFLPHFLFFIAIVFTGFFVFLLLAPLETLNWWTTFYRRFDKEAIPRPQPAPNAEAAEHYVVFLDGIAKASKDNYDDVELFLSKLCTALPDAVVIGSVLPYSVSNRPLTRARPLAKLWQWLKARKINNYKDPLAFGINLRNMLQVLVSADSRYGPLYNLGTARLIITALLKQGYPVGSGIPITLIGYSGGGQVAAGATPYLKELLRAPIDLISLAGVISADPGLEDVRFLYHLGGSKDSVEYIATVVFPGRWPMVKNSSWNRAKNKGKFTYIPMGPMTHNGNSSYLDHKACLENGTSFIDHTVHMVSLIILQSELVRSKRVKQGPLQHLFQASILESTLAPK
jgi:hypothetical protein